MLEIFPDEAQRACASDGMSVAVWWEKHQQQGED
jgi:hypothetical protein